MEYVELLRVRRSLIWNAGIMLVLLVFGIMALGGNSAIHISGTTGTTTISPGVAVPISVLATIAAFFAAIYASSVGTSLNRESLTRDISWTKPISRTQLALRFVLIDLTGVVIAFALALAAIITSPCSPTCHVTSPRRPMPIASRRQARLLGARRRRDVVRPLATHDARGFRSGRARDGRHPVAGCARPRRLGRSSAR